MKKQGFTLVELLGVIVVLSIIVLITVPTIIGIIDKSRKGVLQNSGYGLVEAGTLYNAQYQNSKTIRFDIKDNEVTSKEENKLSYKGSIKEGTVLINNKEEVVVCINDGKYAAYKNFKDNKVTIVDNKTCTIPENSNIVYLDNEATMDINLEDLVAEMNQMKQEIKDLKEEKANQLDMTNSMNNLTNQFNSSQLELNQLKNKINLTKRERIQKKVNIVSDENKDTNIHTFTAPKDGTYILIGSIYFAINENGVRSVRFKAGISPVMKETLSASGRYRTMLPINQVYYLKEGESLEITALQTSGVTLEVELDVTIESSE